MGLSTARIHNATIDMVSRLHSRFPSEHLDIGSGHGELISLMRSRFDVRSSACDYTDELMKLQDVSVKVADLSVESLPYPNASFDIVTSTEVIEHLEHYRETLREIHRVLKPGGTLVVTTPNILNLKSRVRFLINGFYNLFGPLPISERALHLGAGHITPISFFYLAHSMLEAGFNEVEVTIDKRQRTSMAWAVLLWLPIQILSRFTLLHEKRKKVVDERNESYVRKINSMDILLGRTIVVGCKRP